MVDHIFRSQFVRSQITSRTASILRFFETNPVDYDNDNIFGAYANQLQRTMSGSMSSQRRQPPL